MNEDKFACINCREKDAPIEVVINEEEQKLIVAHLCEDCDSQWRKFHRERAQKMFMDWVFGNY